jgi:hypothetical protein
MHSNLSGPPAPEVSSTQVDGLKRGRRWSSNAGRWAALNRRGARMPCRQQPDSCGGPRMRLFVVALWIGQVLGAPVLAAQESAESRLERLQPGQTLRLRLVDGQRLQSTIAAVAGDPFSIRLTQLPTPLTLEAIDSLWVRGRATAPGALVGAGLLGASQVVFWGSLCGEHPQQERVCSHETTAVMTTFGLIGGALLGAGVGLLVPKWRLRYVRSPPGLGLAIPLHW